MDVIVALVIGFIFGGLAGALVVLCLMRSQLQEIATSAAKVDDELRRLKVAKIKDETFLFELDATGKGRDREEE